MNFGTSEDPDYDFGTSQTGFSAPTVSGSGASTVIRIRTSTEVNSATVRVFSRDYGGLAKIRATAIINGVSYPATLSGLGGTFLNIPKDDDGNLLPDAGWYDAEPNFIPSSGLRADADDDPFPSTVDNAKGDNLSVYEEYRGFIALGSHRRTNPRNKDLFIWSNVFPTDIYDATNLPFPKHRVVDGEKDSDRRINFNYANSGFAGSIPGHSDQRCLMVFPMEEFRQEAFGQTLPPLPSGQRHIPNMATRLEIYIQSIRTASPPRFDPINEDQPYDNEAIRHVLGHEVGHGVGMVDRFLNDLPFSVMTIGWLLPPANLDRWNNIPHEYDLNKDVVPYLRLK